MNDFAKIAYPLHGLLRKDVQFSWTQKQQWAFSKLQQNLTRTPILRFPDFLKPFYVATDASGIGLGAILEQEHSGSMQPIAFASRTLAPAEKNHSVTKLEAFGLVWALKRFQSYILGYETIVLTDHAALAPLLKGTNVSGRLARWALVVQKFQPTILYRPRSHNTGPDALSRVSLRRGRAGRSEGEQIHHCVEENSLSLALQSHVCV